MQKNADVSNAYRRADEIARPLPPKDAASQPGYVRLVLRWDGSPVRARAAWRRFASICREEDASRGLIVAESSDGMTAAFADAFEAATAALRRGFKLAVVARGPAAASISKTAASIAARRSVSAKVFASEHQAAGWLMS